MKTQGHKLVQELAARRAVSQSQRLGLPPVGILLL